jgi:hypothetical protein
MIFEDAQVGLRRSTSFMERPSCTGCPGQLPPHLEITLDEAPWSKR